MTSRERVMASLNFKQPDRVPIDFNAHRSSGINVIAYQNLRKYLDLPPSPLYIYDIIQQLAIVEQDVLDKFDVDTFQLGCDFDKKPEYWKDWELEDGTPCKVPVCVDVRRQGNGSFIYNSKGTIVGKQPQGCYYFEQALYPLANDDEKDDFSDYDDIQNDVMWLMVPSPPMPIDFKTPAGARELREIAAATRGKTDRAIYGIFGGNLVETAQYIFRMDNLLCDLLANPERIHKFLDVLLDRHMVNLKAYLDSVGDYIDVIGFGDDMGTQGGPQFSPEVYMDFFYPREKKMWSYIHERFPAMKICLHCCGGVRPLMPLLADAGLDAINPVQFTCKDMALEDLKKELYGKLTLWGGGCDTRRMLPQGKPSEIGPHVKKNLEILNNGGGFIFQQVHNILADIPPVNVVEMFKAVRDFC
ncbi:uroporphyrinogen decarboxylase family protein [Treponema primitia]|uniref:uroporphyrinogen decarboxylase family protein n=1 Tax=Treponema primitia TaxID=88058 RepID=UPI00025550F5|nr:uroporphyrinogen decarboxylase family protein [Treponema primitia]